MHCNCKKDKKAPREAFDKYCAEPDGLVTPVGWNTGPKYTATTFQVFLHGSHSLKPEEELSIRSIKREIAARTLHCLVVSVQPVFALWADVTAFATILEESL